jgi:hypothetical protein
MLIVGFLGFFGFFDIAMKNRLTSLGLQQHLRLGGLGHGLLLTSSLSHALLRMVTTTAAATLSLL